jgi:hypothetical protein
MPIPPGPLPIAFSGTKYYNNLSTNNISYVLNGALYKHTPRTEWTYNQQQRIFNMMHLLEHRPNVKHPGLISLAANMLRSRYRRTWEQNNTATKNRIKASNVPVKRLWPKNYTDPISHNNIANWKGKLAMEVNAPNSNKKLYMTVTNFNKWFGKNWRKLQSNEKLAKTHPLTRRNVLRKHVRLVRFYGQKPGTYASNNLTLLKKKTPLRRAHSV